MYSILSEDSMVKFASGANASARTSFVSTTTEMIREWPASSWSKSVTVHCWPCRHPVAEERSTLQNATFGEASVV